MPTCMPACTPSCSPWQSWGCSNISEQILVVLVKRYTGHATLLGDISRYQISADPTTSQIKRCEQTGSFTASFWPVYTPPPSSLNKNSAWNETGLILTSICLGIWNITRVLSLISRVSFKRLWHTEQLASVSPARAPEWTQYIILSTAYPLGGLAALRRPRRSRGKEKTYDIPGGQSPSSLSTMIFTFISRWK